MINTAIWKYIVELAGRVQPFDIPIGAKVVAFQMQNGAMCMWAIVNRDLKLERRYFFIMGTGNEFESDGTNYIGTAQEGQFVWHLFELTDLQS